MRNIRRLSLALLAAVALAGPAWAGGDDLADLSGDEEARVQRGEIVVLTERSDAPIKRAVVVGLVGAPADHVYRLYTDFENYRVVFGITRSDVIKREGNTSWGKFILEFPWPLGVRWTTNETVLNPEKRSFTFRRADGTFKVYEGSLQVLPEGPGRSRVIYSALIDPDLPIPPWFVQWAQERIFPDIVRDVREYLVETGVRKTMHPLGN